MVIVDATSTSTPRVARDVEALIGELGEAMRVGTELLAQLRRLADRCPVGSPIAEIIERQFDEARKLLQHHEAERDTVVALARGAWS